MAPPEKHVDDDNDEDYNESEDEDFNPEAAAAGEENFSSSGEEEEADEAPTTVKKKGGKTSKRKQADVPDDELDSGDEATIAERKRKRRKKEGDEDSGGEGGLIKTRAQRLAEKTERKERRRATNGAVTVDVEALWADLHSLPIGRPSSSSGLASAIDKTEEDGEKESITTGPAGESELIKIKRRIEFAGEVTEVEEEVLRSSKEAQRYLAEHPEADPDSTMLAKEGDDDDGGIQRPLRRASIFEPNPTAAVRGVPPDKLRPRAPSRVDVLMAEKRATEEKKRKAEKMSTVQKSALDWKGFVSEQGFGQELDEYGKSKGGYLDREHFLDRVQGAKEDARRAAKLKG